MKTQFSRKIELDDRFDVIAVGGGPAGCSAAASAARMRAEMAHVREADPDWVPIDAEVLKRVYDDMVTEAGACFQ